MGRAIVLALAVLLGCAVIAASIWLKPNGFQSCVRIVFSELDRQAASTGATLDPRDMEAAAARICAGNG